MDPEGSIADIDNTIAFHQKSILRFPRSHSKRIVSVQGLAVARSERYRLSRQKEDLDKSILHYTEAILLLPISSVGPRLALHVTQPLFLLAAALLDRFKDFNHTEDVKYSIEYLRHLQRLTLKFFGTGFGIPKNGVTLMLIRALGAQVESGTVDGTGNIGEMVVLCRELLTSNISAEFLVAAFKNLDNAVNTEFLRELPIPLLDEVIQCLRDAVKVCPLGSYEVLFALANQLSTRFFKTCSNDDYEDATALFERILDPNQHGECPDSIRHAATSHITLNAVVRSAAPRKPEFTEVAISRLRAELSSSSIDEGLRFHAAGFLSVLVGNRFRNYGLAESHEEANSYVSRAVGLLSSQSIAKSGEYVSELKTVLGTYSTAALQQKIQHLKELISDTAPGTERHTRLLRGLADLYEAKSSRTNDISDIEECIKYSRLQLNSTHFNEHWGTNPLYSLSEVLLLAFRHTNKTDYLNESIILDYDILRSKSVQDQRFHTIRRLVSSLLIRSRLLGRREDPHEAVRLMSLAVDDQYAMQPDRFRLSCEWAFIARRIRHSSVLTAYKTSISLMQRSLSFAPTVSIQHARLVEMGEHCQRMPLDYASYQIDLGRFEEAIETLEQGRTLIWSEMRGLRTPIAQSFEDSPSAKRFAEINRELELMTVSVTPSARAEMEDGVAQGGDWTDPFGRLLVKQQKLVEERDVLVSQIQGQPGWEGFLKAPPFTTLRSAASRGPVILVNHCEWRSDIIIVFRNSLPCAIPTANDFYDRAKKLRDELVEARKRGLDSHEYQDALCSVLKGLYELVGVPVIKRFRLLGVPEQSRIWWCPTSVFCSLPLHAMGPIPSNNTSERYFSDLYIPSYTPSLSALIESRTASPQMLDKPSLLLVAQPDDYLPGVWGEMKVIQALNARVMNLVSDAATPSSVIEGLRGSQFAHFACHGVLETGKPFEASFKLHGGSRLTLLDMVRSRLPAAEFAFLSCCHAAEITEESIADEGLHLTAAMQYCGFRSVVGTMWEMADTDGRDLAKRFYKSLFSSKQAGVPYYELSAGALRDATQMLRKKRGITLERWVNFVHYGA
ncbi:CHAT domain-containing protein [Lactarius vividus]|nr:CHAT domain-containing protein [Lactarius vividus]